MYLIAKTDIVRGVASRWKEIYCRSGEWASGLSFGSPKEIYEQLLALGEDATEQQITAIIGNNSWTRNVCTECDQDVHVAVHFGEEKDYTAVWADVCLGCLRKAVELVNNG